MPHWKIILSYDGTPYRGWQIQPHLATVQGTLAQAIRRITGEQVLPQGSGRTDTGVHALAQVATFALNHSIPAANLHRALNRALPSSIRILAVDPVEEHFHARHSAVRKTYEYRIFAGDRICSPMLAPYVWACRYDLDLASLHTAATQILGLHDFTSFAASDPDLATRNISAESRKTRQNVRTIFKSSWRRTDDLLVYQVTGSGFLHHMVRNLVGTFVEAGARRIPAGAIAAILLSRDRRRAGPTAPASGLFLIDVAYEPSPIAEPGSTPHRSSIQTS